MPNYYRILFSIPIFLNTVNLYSQIQTDFQYKVFTGDSLVVSLPDVHLKSQEFKFRFFPVGQLVFHNSSGRNLIINSRGAGFSYTEGSLYIESYFYDSQVYGLSGETGDSTLLGLNFVRFKGSGGDQFSPGPASNVDFDGSSGFLKYSFPGGYVLGGKTYFSSGPSYRNSLIFNRTTGDFPLVYFTFNRSVLTYEVLYGFMKNFKSRNRLSDKLIVWHQASLHWPSWLRFYLYEAIICERHSVAVEYLNPLLFLRSSDHYRFSPDNAFLGAGIEINSKMFRFYQEILIDDIETGKLGTGWFRNKLSGLGGVEWKKPFGTGIFSLGLENVWVFPFTYSHRNPNINMNHYGSNLGPMLGPNSIQTGFYFDYESEQKNFSTGVSVELWQAGVTETGKQNVGDDVRIGHPEPPGNLAFADYVRLLDGQRQQTWYISATSTYRIRGIRLWMRPGVFLSDYQTPTIGVKKGWFIESGLRYELPDFEKVRPEFW